MSGGRYNVARYLTERAREQPAAAAVWAPRRHRLTGRLDYGRLSYAELDRESRQVGALLRSRGLGAGSRVLLMVRPGADLIRCCFGLFMVGAVPVVIDPGMGRQAFLHCVARSQPEALLGIPLAQGLSRVFRKAFGSVRERIAVGRGFLDTVRRQEPVEGALAVDEADQLAAILFTSGSTGPPKGVCYGHGQFEAQVGLLQASFGIEAGEVDLPMLPVFSLFNPALGMSTVVPEINPGKPATVKPARILEAIERRGVTNSFGSPVLWKRIADYAEPRGLQFPQIRRILMAGAPVPPVLYRRLRVIFPEAELWSPYGATECLPVSAIEGGEVLAETASATEAGGGSCVGRPVVGVAVRIVPIEDGPVESFEAVGECAVGEIGEIVATGPSVTKRYDQLPEATRAAKIVETDAGDRVWHRMGDAGYLDEDGRIWFCGRLAERVEANDRMYYSDCVEGIFNGMRGVARSALITAGRGERRRPAVVIEGEPTGAPELRHLRERAESFAVTSGIATFFYDDNFPVDVRHNAKIHRGELSKRYAAK